MTSKQRRDYDVRARKGKPVQIEMNVMRDARQMDYIVGHQERAYHHRIVSALPSPSSP